MRTTTSSETYFTGKPCKRGHVVRRYRSTRTCVSCADVRAREWQGKNRRRYLDGANEARRKRLFGISKERYEALLAEQGGGCGICGGQSGKQRFAIDHDHSCCPTERTCGQCVRGLLCHMCNHGLGQFRDSPGLLHRAIAYLAK